MPKSVLNKARKIRRKITVKLARVDLRRDAPQDLGAAAVCIATGTVRVNHAKLLQNTGSDQKVVNQPIHDDHGTANCIPIRTALAIRHQDG
ncbi:hypothetical protein GA0061099_104011 [Bradyrhizobium yuanmingense]|uniref:Uncharacterized protein n=1 Tax=Bradyrhizobium yuanmingense TaxID=108015 RepID=A0A1C3XKY2_9BRAD|nr:hypothetical protein IQ15_07547 [Bradyrhizobium yuanmingense]SCB52795.1 hypothetical protein GA0061099_104011 [Bradyrhizobium yuanmingense]